MKLGCPFFRCFTKWKCKGKDIDFRYFKWFHLSGINFLPLINNFFVSFQGWRQGTGATHANLTSCSHLRRNLYQFWREVWIQGAGATHDNLTSFSQNSKIAYLLDEIDMAQESGHVVMQTPAPYMGDPFLSASAGKIWRIDFK